MDNHESKVEFSLSWLGLSKKEYNLYLACLKDGASTITELSKESNLKRPTAYLCMEQLINKGLITVRAKGRGYLYSAVHPKRLVEIGKFQLGQVERSLPELISLYHNSKGKPVVTLLSGTDDLQLFYNDITAALARGEEALWITNVDAIKSHVPDAEAVFIKMLNEVNNPKIRELIHNTQAGKQWIKTIEKYKGQRHSSKLLPKSSVLGHTDMLIFEDKVILFTFGEELFVIQIEDTQIAKSHRVLFDLIWNKMG